MSFLPIRRLIAGLLRQPRWWNPVKPLPAVGGTPALHAVEPNELAGYLIARLPPPRPCFFWGLI